VAVVSCLALAASVWAGVASASTLNGGAFRWLKPAPAPAGWKHASIPSGGSQLWYPAALRRIGGDSASVSVARRDKSGRILVYLNSTPQQGPESLHNWPAFRISHNRAESDAVHEDAHAVGLPFLGATGSCVIDHYASRVHVHHYKEIACFVEGRTSASVIVAAALASEWKQALPLLERAVSAYRVD
jgi:hypothetical protein